MELLCPAGFPIHLTEDNKHGRFEFQNLFLGELGAAIYFVEDGFDFGIGIVFGVEFLDAVVGEFAALLGEELVTFSQGGNHVVKGRDGDTAHFAQFLNISAEVGRNLYGHGLVGTPSGEHLDFETAFASLDVVFERIDGVVGGAHHLYMITAHHAPCRIFGKSQFGITFFIDFACGFRAENLVDAESRFQFEVCPVIERVAHGVGDGLGPFLKFFPVGGVFARAVAFIDTVGAHGAPFVVVSAEPYLGQRFELVVIGHHLGNQVAVIVDDGHFSRVVVI